MKSILALFAVLVLLLIAKTSHARPGMGSYWHVKNGEAMLMIHDHKDMRDSVDSTLSNRKSDRKDAVDIVHEKLSADESDPVPDLTICHGNFHLKGRKNLYEDESSDTVPDLIIYHGDSPLKGKNSYIDESDLVPDATIYRGDSRS